VLGCGWAAAMAARLMTGLPDATGSINAEIEPRTTVTATAIRTAGSGSD